MAAPDELPPPHDGILPASAVTGARAVAEEPAPIPLPPPQTPPPDYPARFLRGRRILDAALVVVVLLLAFEVALFPARNSDLLLNMAVGRLIAHHEYSFGADPFTFTAEGVRWVNHSWLFGLFAYGMHQLGPWGGAALVLLKALAIAALAEVLLRLGRRPGSSLWAPALCTALAVLAISPRALLQPVCLSYLFLGLTLYLLELPRRRAAAGAAPVWGLRWLIPLLCALWVNCDAWFLLGPLTIGLYWLGELLEGDRAPAGDGRRVLVILAASVIACLANPYHVFAFKLPDQLGLSPAGALLQGDGTFRRLFLSPWVQGYFDFPMSRSVAGLAYYPLAVLGAASFVLTAGSWRNWRGPVFVAFFLLSAWHARAIPFFAVVAGPILALNLLEHAALRFGTDVPADLDWRRRLLSFRALSLLAGFVALAAGLSGLLHVPIWRQQNLPETQRPNWGLEFDPAMTQAAEQIARWREQKLVPADAHWFNASPEIVHYLAWYAPGARGFMDLRLSLYSAEDARDYRDIRAALLKSTEQRRDGRRPAPEDTEWGRVFAVRQIAYVVVGEGGLSRTAQPFLVPLLLQPDEWSLCYLYGGAAVFGWKDAPGASADAFGPIRFDPARLAFGSKATQAPRQRPRPPLADAEWWQLIWQPDPPRSADSDDAAVHLLSFEIQRVPQLQRDVQVAVLSLIPSAGGSFGPIANGTAARERLYSSADLFMRIRDVGPQAELYLAVRAARRATMSNSDDARSWLLLGQAYHNLYMATRERSPGFVSPHVRELRQTQLIAALTRAVKLDPNLEKAYEILAEMYRNRFLDLELRNREGQARCLAARGENTEKIDLEVDRLKKLLKDKQDQYELKAAGANLQAAQKALIALQHGLADTALQRALEQVRQPGEGANAEAPASAALDAAVRLMLWTGQIDDARLLVLTEDGRSAPMLGKHRLPDMPSPPVLPEATGDWYRVLIAAAAGDYTEVDATLEDLVAKSQLVPLGRPPSLQSITALVPAGVGAELLNLAPLAAGCPGLLPRVLAPELMMQRTQALRDTYGRFAMTADLQTLRGWLALEAGDVATARRELREAVVRSARPGELRINFASLPLARMLLEWIEKNGDG